MRTYIHNFLNEYQYPENARETLLNAYDKIVGNAEACSVWNEAIALYEANHKCDYGKIIDKADKAADLIGMHEYTLELLVFICLSKHLKELYIEKGICLELYRKSMEDLRYKLDECQLVYGIVGSFVAGWFGGFFDLTRFGMGRLQFEVVSFGSNYEKNGITLTPETKVINVHIPRSGEPLTEEACREAYLLAKEFFKAEINAEPCPFVCDSWLLYPENEKILSEKSNTYKFFKSFDVFQWRVNKNRGDLWRLFDTMEQNVDRLPVNTSMRRAYAEHLKKGGKVGSGKGILFI